jgi:hypothetical protein
MIDRREYLRSQGFTVGPRGRFSREMLDALVKAGYDGGKAVQPKVEKIKTTKAPKAPAQVARIIRPNRATKYVHIDEKGKRHEISNTNACRWCGWSLLFCNCAEPHALVKGFLDYVPVSPV